MHGMMWIFLIVLVGAAAWILGSKNSSASEKKSDQGSEGEVEVLGRESPEEKKSSAVPAAFWVALGVLGGALAAMFLMHPHAGPDWTGRCSFFSFSGHSVFSPGIFIIAAIVVFAVIVLLKKRG